MADFMCESATFVVWSQRASWEAWIEDDNAIEERLVIVIPRKGWITKQACPFSVTETRLELKEEYSEEKWITDPTEYTFSDAAPPARRSAFMSFSCSL